VHNGINAKFNITYGNALAAQTTSTKLLQSLMEKKITFWRKNDKH